MNQIEQGSTTELVWKFIQEYMTTNHGRPPSTREMCEGTGISTGTIGYQLDKLKKLGLITMTKKENRNIRIVDSVFFVLDKHEPSLKSLQDVRSIEVTYQSELLARISILDRDISHSMDFDSFLRAVFSHLLDREVAITYEF